MITNFKKLLIDAQKKGYALPHFNCNNPDWIRVVLKVAQHLKSPVIVSGVAAQIRWTAGSYKTWMCLINDLIEEQDITIPVIPHLDHGSYEECVQALEDGVPSVMFDGSNLNFKENLRLTKNLVKLAKTKNASLEVEVGTIGNAGVDGFKQGEIADVKQCQEMANLGIDLLAAGVGNIHGAYPSNWKSLAFNNLMKIHQMTYKLPLSLHGGSGIPDDQIKKAILLGICKINVHTELFEKFKVGIIASIKEHIFEKEKMVQKILTPGYLKMEEVIAKKIKLFNAEGKVA